MTRLLAIAAMVCATLAASAQTPRLDFKRDIRQSASNQLAYPGPEPGTTLTPPPDTLHPYLISHYGRHGSRYLINPQDYDRPLRTLRRADSLGVLTLLGHDLLRRIEAMRAEATDRFGELTPLGWRQHSEIAGRMYDRFGEVFQGDARVDAKSTVVIRCILSMQSELLELSRRNPSLRITADASEHDMHYMNRQDTALWRLKRSPEANQAYEQYYKETVDVQKVMRRIFRNQRYATDSIDARALNDQLFHLASAMQNTEQRHKITFYDLFDDDDILANWRVNNAQWYIRYGACPLTGGRQPWSQGALLAQIIADADSCIALGQHGATLRFGHETVLLPLVCLMGLNDYHLVTTNLDALDNRGWLDYKVFPMGGNVQLVFYRRDAADHDPLVKVLLNEAEATLPIKAVTGPYYRWADVKDYWLETLHGKAAEHHGK